MFKPGISGNPNGRPKGSGSGRAQALAVLDTMFSCRQTQDELLHAMRKEFKKDPVHFFKTVVMPLRPREDRQEDNLPMVTEWPSLLSKDRPPATEKSPDDAGGEEPAAQ